ncbi:hypothetical protein LAJLEIBI_02261 [[Clostridium] hylemonae DSM 15053]|nr:hypothetical protein LAJLEIBI_02261 [[Clostridium] hylemonae DSM 15053]
MEHTYLLNRSNKRQRPDRLCFEKQALYVLMCSACF